MPHGLFQRLSGVNGRVVIEDLGANIGTIKRWELRQRGGDDDPSLLYELRAEFSYINGSMFLDPEYEKLLIVEMGRRTQRLQLRVQVVDGEGTVLRDRTLLMKGVTVSEYKEGRARSGSS